MFEKSTDLYRIMSVPFKREARIKSKKLELSVDFLRMFNNDSGVTHAILLEALFTVWQGERPIMLIPINTAIKTTTSGLAVDMRPFVGVTKYNYGLCRWCHIPYAYSEDTKRRLIDIFSVDRWIDCREPQLDEEQIKIILTLDSGRMPESVNGNCKLWKTVNTFLRKFLDVNYTNILMYMEKDISVRFKDVPVKPIDIEFEV